MKRSIAYLVLGLLGLLAGVAGCSSEDHPAVTPVSGRVMYRGQPVANAHVTFMNESAVRAATGVTDEQGEFQLTTFETNDGAAPGLNKVAVTKATGMAPVTDLEGEAYAQAMQQIATPTKPPESEIPIKYANTNTTPLTVEVRPDEENRFEITLED